MLSKQRYATRLSKSKEFGKVENFAFVVASRFEEEAIKTLIFRVVSSTCT